MPSSRRKHIRNSERSEWRRFAGSQYYRNQRGGREFPALLVTGTRGEFRLPALSIGTYDVQATLAGFQTSIRKGMTLNVGQDAVVDLSLGVGKRPRSR